MSEREVMSWDDLGTGARELAEAVVADGYVPDIILGIARGGLLVAGALGYAIGVKNTFTMNVEFYTGIDERLDLPMILPPVPDLIDFADTKVLIADDVADTGATLKTVHAFCAGKVADQVRVRLAPDRSLDHLPVERGRARLAGASRGGLVARRKVG
jgi:hypoxanthine phosphoribosyltransferase